MEQINNTTDKQASPYSIRFTAEERTLFDAMAKEMNMKRAELIRLKLFTDSLQEKFAVRSQNKTAPNKELAQVLALLGRSNMPNNLNQITRSIHMGTLELTPEIEAQILEMHDTIMWIRRNLIKSLGLKVTEFEEPER